MLGGEEKEDLQSGGYFIHPTIIADVDAHARIAQEEIFGPVLAVIKANDFDHALDIANSTDYALTGAVFSYNREHLERAQARVPRRQPVPEPQMHGRARGRAALRRLQHERHGQQGGRARLPGPVRAGEIRLRAVVAIQLVTQNVHRR